MEDEKVLFGKTKEEIAEAVKSARNLQDACHKLGVIPMPKNVMALLKEVKAEGLDTSHFVTRPFPHK